MKNKFKDGDIVTDTRYNEVFVFDTQRDGRMTDLRNSELRLATESEKQKLIESGETSIKLSN